MKEVPVLLRAVGLKVGYVGRPILPALDFEVRVGELWAIVGRNGAGKTTLLRTLLGLLSPVSGRVERPTNAPMAYVPQRFAIDPLVPCRARDLIAEGVDHGWSFLRPWRTPHEKQRIASAIEATETGALLGRRYRDLSEGQKQRVLLARAIAAGPDVLVLDEPTSAMDPVAEHQTAELIAKLRFRSPMAVLLVTHRTGLVSTIADHVLYVDAEASIVRAGTIGEVSSDPVFETHDGALLDSDRRVKAPRLDAERAR